MSESMQAVLALLMIVGVLGSVMVFMNDHVSWAALVGLLTLAMGSLGLLLWSMFRREKLPDSLRRFQGPRLERDGFCFVVNARPEKGRCYLDLHFQSRYEGHCRAMVVLQPSQGFFLTRPDLGSATVEIDCPAGACGVTSVPWPVGKKFQGKTQSFDVGADVFYPEGRGRVVRYRGGVQIGPAGFDTWRAVLTVAAAMGGIVLLGRSARVKLRLPTGVEETVDDDLPIATRIVWAPDGTPDPASIKKGAISDPDF